MSTEPRSRHTTSTSSSPSEQVKIVANGDASPTSTTSSPSTDEYYSDSTLRPHRLLTYDELPHWMQDNKYILTSYRPPTYSILKSIVSLTYIHNETFNIYSHLLPALSIPFLTYYLYTYHTNDHDSSILTSTSSSTFTTLTNLPRPTLLALSTFPLGAFICLLTSSLYHLLAHTSPMISKWGNQLDYLGIIFLIWGSFIPTLYHGFYCHEGLLRVYLSMITLLSFICGCLTLHPDFRSPGWRTTRARLFVALGLSAVFPIIHALFLDPLNHTHQEKEKEKGGGSELSYSMRKTLSLEHVLLQGAIYIIGAGIYAARIPERLSTSAASTGASSPSPSSLPSWFQKPSRFDIWGSSHQIFHACVVIAVGVHGWGIWKALVLRFGHGYREGGLPVC